jgi:hypothetical protein
MKKDYLYGGAMADSADLVVLGAWFGTGQKGKILNICASKALITQSDSWVSTLHSLSIAQLFCKDQNIIFNTKLQN